MAKKRFHSSESYAGYESRKNQEASDSHMITEDHSAIANLPKEVMFKEYPKTDYYTYGLDDTQTEVNHQIDADVRGGTSKATKAYPEKY